MQQQTEAEVEALAQHIEGEEGLYTSKEAAQALISHLENNGGTLYIMESTYWGKETFGPDAWTDMFIGTEVVTTEKGVKVKNGLDAHRVLGDFRQLRRTQAKLEERAEDEEGDFTLPDSYYEDKMDQALESLNEGRYSHGLGSGWFPKSKCLLRVHRDGPEQFVVFDGDSQKRGHRTDAECIIEGTTSVSTKYNVYTKLAIDVPYDEDKNPKDFFDWEEHHFSAKYVHDDFECWTADTRPREIANILAENYDGCAVHEDVLENFEE